MAVRVDRVRVGVLVVRVGVRPAPVAVRHVADQVVELAGPLLELERRVVYVEARDELAVDIVYDLAAVAGVVLLYEYVRGERGDARAYAPHVHPVRVHDVLHLLYLLDHVLYVQPFRHSFKQDVRGLVEHLERAPQYHEREDYAECRVHHVPAGEVHHRRARYHADGYERVAQDVQERAPHVYVVVVVSPEPVHDQYVYYQAERRHHEHPDALDRLRVHDAEHRLVEYHAGDDYERRAVDERGEDLAPVPAVGARVGRGEPGEHYREEREPECDQVGQDVRRVGEKGQGVRHEPA